MILLLFPQPGPLLPVVEVEMHIALLVPDRVVAREPVFNLATIVNPVGVNLVVTANG